MNSIFPDIDQTTLYVPELLELGDDTLAGGGVTPKGKAFAVGFNDNISSTAIRIVFCMLPPCI
jgi:hypothetical protein